MKGKIKGLDQPWNKCSTLIILNPVLLGLSSRKEKGGKRRREHMWKATREEKNERGRERSKWRVKGKGIAGEKER